MRAINLTHFNGCKTLDEVKKLYRELVVKYHPDRNPNIDIKIIQEVNAQYSHITKKGGVVYPIKAEEMPWYDNPRGSGYAEYKPTGFSAFEEALRKQREAVNKEYQKAQQQAEEARARKQNNYTESDEARHQAYRENARKAEQQRSHKSEEEYHKQRASDEIKQGLYDLIRRGHEQVKERGYKPMALYYKFVGYCMENNIVADKSHFDLIGELLGYSKGWSYYKYNEYLEQLKQAQ